jgi:uncharacterized membrane protein
MSRFLSRLDEAELRGAERLSAWLLILFGYFVAIGMSSDSSGWDDPVFNVVRHVPWTPYSWAGALALFTVIFHMGYVLKPERDWRGRVIIIGALLCAGWWMAMALCTARMVYEMPTRITDLWPLICFFASCMYLTRVVVYANSFTGDRWNTNPYQTWSTTFLMLASLSQVIIGITPVSVLSEIERPAALTVGAGNLFGAAVTMLGLHLKDKEIGLMYELAGAFSLVLTLGWYCAYVLHNSPLAGVTLGFSMPEAFVFATLHRATQIATLKWARSSQREALERRMIHALNPTAKPAHAESLKPEVEPEVASE